VHDPNHANELLLDAEVQAYRLEARNGPRSEILKSGIAKGIKPALREADRGLL
jgi:hypothetical protein